MEVMEPRLNGRHRNIALLRKSILQATLTHNF